MREKYIEKKLREAVKAAGGMVLKFVSPGFDGVPDRLVLMPEGKAFFAETKALGKTLRPLQQRRKEQLEQIGFRVYVIDDTGKIRSLKQMGSG